MTSAEDQLSLFRSFSVPNISPSRKYERLYIEKVIQTQKLRKQISCEFIYDKSNGSQKSSITVFESPLKNEEIKKICSLKTDELQHENNKEKVGVCSKIMEVVEMVGNGKTGSNKLSDHWLPKQLELEKFFKKGKTVSGPLKKKRSKCFYATSITICSIAVVYYLLLQTYNYYYYLPLCKDKVGQMHNIKQDLLQNVTAQKHVVETVISSFENMGIWSQPLKVLSFVGTSGVGKTFVTSHVRNHFDKDYLHELKYTDLFVNFQKDKLKSECCNLFVIDNLFASDVELLINFIEKLPKDCFIMFLPVFNIQGKRDDLNSEINLQDLELIKNSFEKSGLYHEILLFDQLTKEDAINWLKNEFTKYNVHFLHEKIEKLISETDDFTLRGFKGLHRKIYLELMKMSKD